MKKSATRSLRSIVTAAAPLGRLPVGVVRQLMGYYGDWRRSRDILNRIDEATAARSYSDSFLSSASLPGSSNSFPAR